MRRVARRLLPALAPLLLATTAEAQFTVYGVTAGTGAQQLVRFSATGTTAPGAVTTLGPTGASLIGIDFRPASGVLYGYNGDRLFTLNLTTGAATPSFDVANTSGAVGFDFNPVPDRLRIVDEAGNNLRLNQLDGTLLGDPGFTYANPGLFAGQVPTLSGAGYTNNDNDPATPTQLYAIDASRGVLVLLGSPNGGPATVQGTLGLGTGFAVNGFDIVTVGGVNTAFLAVLGAGATTSTLYTVNLMNGATTSLGTIASPGGLTGIAVVPGVSAVPEPSSVLLLGSGLAVGAAVLRRRRRTQG